MKRIRNAKTLGFLAVAYLLAAVAWLIFAIVKGTTLSWVVEAIWLIGAGLYFVRWRQVRKNHAGA